MSTTDTTDTTPGEVAPAPYKPWHDRKVIHLALKRAIRHAEASDLVTRNVATLADTPKASTAGRPDPSPWTRP